MKLGAVGILLVIAGCSSAASSDSSGADAQAAAEFCSDFGACTPDPSCGGSVCCDGRDCTSDCVAVARRFRAELIPQLEGCFAICGEEECVNALEAESDDRPIDAAFEQACTAGLACDPGSYYTALCTLTGLYTEAVLRAAMDCLTQDCSQRDRCLANATFCHPTTPNDFCF